MRKTAFYKNGYYHIYNRGVDKRLIFQDDIDYSTFLYGIKRLLKTGSATKNIQNPHHTFETKLSFIAYCLMPNHYHFLIKQIDDTGIPDFMHALATSYTKYFNKKNNRTGRLFEFSYKAKEIDSDELLVHLARYIHLNPVIGKLVLQPEKYLWASYIDYIGKRNGTLCNKQEIIAYHRNTEAFRRFTLDQMSYAQQLHRLKHLTMDNN